MSVTSANEEFRHWHDEVQEEILQRVEKLSLRRKAMQEDLSQKTRKLRRKGMSEQEAEKLAAEEVRKANVDYYVEEEDVEVLRKKRERQLADLCDKVAIAGDGGELREVDACSAYAYSSQTNPLKYAHESLIPLEKYLQRHGVRTHLTVERDPPTGTRWEVPTGTARLLADCEPYVAAAAKMQMTWEFMSEAWGWTVNPAVHIPGLPGPLLAEHWRRNDPMKRS